MSGVKKGEEYQPNEAGGRGIHDSDSRGLFSEAWKGTQSVAPALPRYFLDKTRIIRMLDRTSVSIKLSLRTAPLLHTLASDNGPRGGASHPAPIIQSLAVKFYSNRRPRTRLAIVAP